MRDLAVVLLSGGMDSCVTAAIARQSYELALLHLQYGQRTQQREEKSFHDIGDFYSIPRHHRLVIRSDHLASIGGSSLTDASISVTDADLSRTDIPPSYVPFRNANLLSMAVSWAEVLGARAIFVGAVEEDSSGYPDCREEFFKAFEVVVRYGTRPTTNIAIETPVLHMKKSDIVLQGLSLGAPLQLTWSCYRSDDLACGTCDSCALRLRGFAQARASDPIPYKVRPSYP